MELWPLPFESRCVQTRFGNTHTVVCGPSDAAPLLLLHAATGFGATQWYPNVADLAQQYHVHAVDFIGSAGKGSQTAPILSEHDCATWLSDLLDELGLDRAHMAGSSQGGWLALNFALKQPARVTSLALLAPAAAIWPISPLMRAFIRIGPLMPAWSGPPSIKALFGGRAEIDPRIVRLLSMHLKHFRYQDRAVFPTPFTDEALCGLPTRNLLLVPEYERIYDPHKALERAQRLIPRLEAELVMGVGHLINMEAPVLTSQRLLRFFGEAASLSPFSTSPIESV
jgi:pimeloyl-ACP methyl ester carboxylesterase